MIVLICIKGFTMQNKRFFGILVLTCVIFLLQASDKFYFSKFSKPTSQTSDNLNIDKKISPFIYSPEKLRKNS